MSGHLDDATLQTRPTGGHRPDEQERVHLGLAGAASTSPLFHASRDVLASYLIGYVFWLNITLGSLDFLLQPSRRRWGIVSRRVLESSVRNFPVMLILFSRSRSTWRPYHWATPEGAADPSPAQAAVPEQNVLPHPRGGVLRDLDRPQLHARRLSAKQDVDAPVVPPGRSQVPLARAPASCSSCSRSR